MKIIDIALKDMLRSTRSLFAVGMMLVVPLLIVGLLNFAFGGLRSQSDAPDLPVTNVAVVNLDQPVNGQSFGELLIEYLRDERLVDLISVTEMRDEASTRAAVDKQEAGVAILIPANFSAAVADSDGRATLTLIQDPTLTLGPRIVRDIVSQFVDGFSGAKIAMNVVGDQLTAEGVVLDAAGQVSVARQYAVWAMKMGEAANRSASGIDVQTPAAALTESSADSDPLEKILSSIAAGMLIFFSFYGSAYTAQSILREEEEGTLARLLTTPTPRAVILGGKFVQVFVTVAVQVVVLMSASSLAFGVQWGQPLTISLMVIGLVTVASGFGLFIISLVKTLRQSGPVLGGALTVTGMMSGLFTTGVRMPDAFQTISLSMPQGWALRGWTLALDGAGAGEVLLPLAVMMALGAIFFALGVVNFRKRIA